MKSLGVKLWYISEHLMHGKFGITFLLIFTIWTMVQFDILVMQIDNKLAKFVT